MHRTAGVCLSLLLLTAVPGVAATDLRLLPSSQVWLDGTTNVHAWHCAGGSLGGDMTVEAPATELHQRLQEWERRPAGALVASPQDAAADWRTRMSLRVPVAALRCGNPAMERDMRKALRAVEYPVIDYRFTRVREARNAPAGAVPAFDLVVEGEISLAGTTRPIVVDVVATHVAADRFRLRGGQALKMTDFGIDPPVALLGLIRARDELWVSVDLEVSLAATANDRVDASN